MTSNQVRSSNSKWLPALLRHCPYNCLAIMSAYIIISPGPYMHSMMGCNGSSAVESVQIVIQIARTNLDTPMAFAPVHLFQGIGHRGLDSAEASAQLENGIPMHEACLCLIIIQPFSVIRLLVTDSNHSMPLCQSTRSRTEYSQLNMGGRQETSSHTSMATARPS
jgi:hypothetical protein